MTAAAAPIALTMGEPAGVGAEITAKAWQVLRHSGPVFFILDAPERYQRYSIPVQIIDTPDMAHGAFSQALPVMPLNEPVDDTPGVLSPAHAPAVIAAIDRAVNMALAGSTRGVVTNPIQKSILGMAGFSFPGHTEYLDALTEGVAMPADAARGPVMMIAGPDLRTVPVTIHQSVCDAARSLSQERIMTCARVVHDALRRQFAIPAPRLAISGLNPHAGEAGRMGTEDRDIIAPAVAALIAMDINAVGPLPADTMFHARARAGYDVALCMLHDQALIPAKTLAFDDAVNVTLGLPIVRTSPDHGTALDIAGKGLARPDSLIAAIRLADILGTNQSGEPL